MTGSNHQENVDDVPHEHRMHRTGSWLPSDHRVHKDWLSKIIEKAKTDPKDLHPVLQEFKKLIEENTRIYLLVNSMFDEIPTKKPYRQDPVGHKQVRDYPHMLELFNHILSHAPEWSDNEYGIGMVGTPVNAILDWFVTSLYELHVRHTLTSYIYFEGPWALQVGMLSSWTRKSTKC
jgi:phosphatidylserine decarboxylase